MTGARKRIKEAIDRYESMVVQNETTLVSELEKALMEEENTYMNLSESDKYTAKGNLSFRIQAEILRVEEEIRDGAEDDVLVHLKKLLKTEEANR